MQESPHEREGVDNKYFRVLTGLVGLVALSYVADSLVLAIMLVLLHSNQVAAQFSFVYILIWVASFVGWGGLVYACWIRSGRITDTNLAFVLAMGVLGMAITLLALTEHPVPPYLLAGGIVHLIGMWILNGLGIVWIVHKVRRIKAASNTDEADASR